MGCWSAPTFRGMDGETVGVLDVVMLLHTDCWTVRRCNLWMLQRLDVQMLRLWNSSVFHCLNVPVSQRYWVAMSQRCDVARGPAPYGLCRCGDQEPGGGRDCSAALDIWKAVRREPRIWGCLRSPKSACEGHGDDSQQSLPPRKWGASSSSSRPRTSRLTALLAMPPVRSIRGGCRRGHGLPGRGGLRGMPCRT